MTEILAEQLETEESMFVQTAQGIDSDGKTLTLHGITPSTLYFSDRPKRVVGHLTTTDFVDLWAIGDNSFESDPPNAVLAYLEPGADVPDDAVIELKQPILDGDRLLLRERLDALPVVLGSVRVGVGGDVEIDGDVVLG